MKSITGVVLILVLLVAGAWVFWMWGVCRFYVEPNQMAVITAKIGKQLPPGQILAADGQKGIREKVLGEGRHFLNPILYNHEILPVAEIPPGKVGLVTSKVGTDLPEGEFLAEPGQKGIWRSMLGPGKYRLNPYGYTIDIVDAISIPIGYVGVVTSQSGRQAPEGEFAKAGEKGVREDILQPGLYYANPKEFKIDVLEVGVNQVSLLGREGGRVLTKNILLPSNAAVDELQRQVLMNQQEKRADYFEQKAMAQPQADTQQRGQARAPRSQQRPSPAQQAGVDAMAGFTLDQYVTFPSRDGFEISLDMTVEFELKPDVVASVFRGYGDLPALVDKIIMPQVLSISRLKGSAYRATDFIIGEGREKFQLDLTEALAKILADRQVLVHNALIRHVNVPMQILDPIQQASIAQEQDLTNQEKQNTARKQAELNTQMSLIEQRGQEVAQETEKLVAEIEAEREKEVAEIAADTIKQAAEIERATAAVNAEKVRKIGTAKADVVRMVEGEKARGFQLKALAFGDPVAFSLWSFAEKLNPDLRVNILHAGEGTLWTDLEKAGAGDLGGAAILRKETAPKPGAKP